MDKKLIEELKKLKSNQLKVKIIQYLMDSKITVDELVQACKDKKIEVSIEVLNKVGVWCGKEKDTPFDTYTEALTLFEYSAELGDSSAMGNLAVYYFEGYATNEEDLASALYWCERAIENGNIACNIFKDNILEKQKKYDQAIKPPKKNTNDAGKGVFTDTDSSNTDTEALKKPKEPKKEIKAKIQENTSEKPKDKKFPNNEDKDDAETLNYKGKIVKHTVVVDNCKMSVYGFPDKGLAKEKEILWEQETGSKFFRFGKDLREGKRASEIYELVEKQINSKKSVAPVVIDHQCRRSFIIALSKILTKHDGMPDLTFKLGRTIIVFQRTDDSKKIRQHGNFQMVIPNLGSFQHAYGNGCMIRLQHLISPSWDSKVIGKVIVNKTRNDSRRTKLLGLIKDGLERFRPFTYTDFNKYGSMYVEYGVSSEGSSYDYDKERLQYLEQNIDFLNGLIFLSSIVEVLVRSYRTQSGDLFDYEDENGIESDSFPVAMAQARSISLLISQKITLEDFFGQLEENVKKYGAALGAVTGTKTTQGAGLSLLSQKLSDINDCYNKFYFDQNTPWADLKTEYLQCNTDGILISGKSKMYTQLKKVYGAGAESDPNTSDYSDDESTQAVLFKPKASK